DAFLACRFVIDHLKRHATFWKKEILLSGEERWVQGCPGCEEAAHQWDALYNRDGAPQPGNNGHAQPAPPHAQPLADWRGLRVGLLTLSDSRTQSTDQSGAALATLLSDWGATITRRALLPDDQSAIQELLCQWADGQPLDIIVTTGGTGPGARDVTPEATRAVCNRELPGFAELIRAAGLQQTRNAILTRGVTAVRGSTIVINLPGSTRGAVHSLQAVADLLPHALRMVTGGGHGP
ncbi:MAG: hypothetical protein HQL88_05370, partial [Magnetococcales bacterium]|nr:hypothetical protein [Magnetococcales bacterium]